jgi:hypothetical protein
MTDAARREIEEQLRKVAIHLTWYDLNSRLQHGTAFFVTGEGVALTAFHNIEQTIAVNPSGRLDGTWQGQSLQFRWKLPEENQRHWQQKYDIAVLQADTEPVGIVTLMAGYLEPDLADGRRGAHWNGSGVLVAGFPKGKDFELDSGSGFVSQMNPLDSVEVNGKKREAVLNFSSSIVERGSQHGPGLSGSPVYSLADGSIVGITLAVRTNLYATELWPIYQNWEQSGAFLKRLKLRPPPREFPDKFWGALRTAVVICILLIALAGWMRWRQTKHNIPRELSAEVTRLQAGNTEPVKEGSAFRIGEQVRFHFSSPKDGYLYVVDQEIVGGQAKDPMIIFPTLRTGVGRNHVKAGALVDFPSEDDVPPYLEAESAAGETAYQGELLTLLIFPSALPVTLKTTPIPLEPALFSLDGLRPREFIHPLAPSDDAVAIRQIRLRITR